MKALCPSFVNDDVRQCVNEGLTAAALVLRAEQCLSNSERADRDDAPAWRTDFLKGAANNLEAAFIVGHQELVLPSLLSAVYLSPLHFLMSYATLCRMGYNPRAYILVRTQGGYAALAKEDKTPGFFAQNPDLAINPIAGIIARN